MGGLGLCIRCRLESLAESAAGGDSVRSMTSAVRAAAGLLEAAALEGSAASSNGAKEAWSIDLPCSALLRLSFWQQLMCKGKRSGSCVCD